MFPQPKFLGTRYRLSCRIMPITDTNFLISDGAERRLGDAEENGMPSGCRIEGFSLRMSGKP